MSEIQFAYVNKIVLGTCKFAFTGAFRIYNLISAIDKGASNLMSDARAEIEQMSHSLNNPQQHCAAAEMKEKDLQYQKVKTLSTISNYMVTAEKETELQLRISELLACNADDFKHVRQNLLMFVQSENRSVIRSSVEEAIKQSCNSIGFTKLKSFNASPSKVITVAENDSGQSMVHELNIAQDKREIKSEVLGVNDNSCHAIINGFNEGLKLNGIHLHRPTDRKKKGGLITQKNNTQERQQQLQRRRMHRIKQTRVWGR